ncbi:MAG: hypothetical protein U0694_07355 [Anaerolineae bacterium]
MIWRLERQPRAGDALPATPEKSPARRLHVLASSTDAIPADDYSAAAEHRADTAACEYCRQRAGGTVRRRPGSVAAGAVIGRAAGLGGARKARAVAARSAHAGIGHAGSAFKENRAGRFTQAEELAKDKLALVSLLELWQTFWRDVMMMTEDTALPPVNADRVDSSNGWRKR